MNVTPVVPAQALADIEGIVRLTVVAPPGFDADQLGGPKFEGKVLRQLGPGRYLAELGDKQVTIEVQQLLKPGETFVGRANKSGGVNVLELVRNGAAPSGNDAASPAAHESAVRPASGLEGFFRRSFANHSLEADADEIALLAAIAQRPVDRRQLAGIGLLMRRAGLRISEERVQGVLDQLAESGNALFNSESDALAFSSLSSETVLDSTGGNQAFLSKVAEFISVSLEIRGQSEGVLKEGDSASALAAAQSRFWNQSLPDGGRHWAHTFPVALNGRETHVDLVMRDDGWTSSGNTGAGRKRVFLTFSTQALGKLQIDLRLASSQASLAVGARTTGVAEIIARHEAALRAAFAAAGMRLDELTYESGGMDETDWARRALSEHVFAAGGMDIAA